MKTLSNLTAESSETNFTETPIHPFTLGQQPVKGYARAMRITPAGIVFKNSSVSLALPLAELWKLAEEHEPRLAPPNANLQRADQPTPPSAGDETQTA